MTPLQRKALGTIPLTYAVVESFYDGNSEGTVLQCLKALCASHERLRAEVEGMAMLLQGDRREILRLHNKLAAALALTDTGSEEFREAFPPKAAGDVVTPREAVPGWRVIDRIREVLLGD